MNRIQKQQAVSYLKKVFETYNTIIIAHNKGLTVGESNRLRKQIKSVDGRCSVVKNKLARIALSNTQYENLKELFCGPVTITYANDAVEVAKVLVRFCKENDKLELISGAIGESKLNVAQIKNLATLPPLDDLRGKLVGLLNAPSRKLMNVLQAPGAQIARVLNAYSNK